MNDVTTIPNEPLWDPNSGLPMPAYLADALGDLGSNIADRMMVPSLSYEGKVWSIVKDGNRNKLEAKNQDGDMVPIPVMRLIVLNYNPDRGRAFYDTTYNPAASAAPKCWSADGVAPDASAREKQSALCNSCPQSVKGSKIVDGREMIACSSHRMLAVAPAFDITDDPLRLKIAVTSDYDKEIVEHGWFAFRQYTDWLKSRGMAHTALVVTKVKFDSNPAFPKLLFALDRSLSPAEIGQVREALKNPKIDELLAEKWTPAGRAGTPIVDDLPPQPEIPASHQTIDAVATKPKPTEATHIANTGTDHEVWWDGEAWVKPWVTPQDVVAQPQTPPPPPAPEPEPVAAPVVVDPMAAAEVDGWIAHPDAPGYHYKGQEVVADLELSARYPTASAAPPAPAATSAPAPTAEAATSGTATAASPSETPPDVQALLDKWNPQPGA